MLDIPKLELSAAVLGVLAKCAALAQLFEVDLFDLLHLDLLLDVDRDLGRHPAHALGDMERVPKRVVVLFAVETG